ncbi:hypothetical protein NDU88_001534 [Pleurodeles waltl]|uniref:Uncharacterized protein n=1 Tax=Pleurodeles waltl TaxID=8319 RepID=A0AAV7VC05_PLEWA|nr:hypothetical protein NDU88_001534 [Pleurodeles waltl]
MGAAPNDVRRKNAVVERVFKPVRDERQEEGFSPRGENMAMTDSRMNRPEQKSGRRRRQGEVPRNLGLKLEGGDWEEGRSEQTGQVWIKNEAGNGENGNLVV